MRQAMLIASAIVAGLAAAPFTAPAQAQDSKIYPWCFETGRGSKNCGFVSFQQCRATMSGDNSGSCVANPFFVAAGSRRSSRS